MRTRLLAPLVLFALAAPPAGAALTWKGHYRVNPGDSLTEVAADYGVTLVALAQANGLSPSSTLRIGALLRVPIPSLAATPAWQGRHRVQSGDSLTTIASDYGTTLATLAAANKLDPAKPLLIGTVLKVPTATPTPAKPRPPAWKGRYTVQGGDSLGALAHDYDTTLAALAAANELDPAKPLLIGTVLTVPTATRTPAKPRPPAWKGRYTVQGGDSLGALAHDYGTTLTALAAANNLDPAKPLLIGTVLTVPTATPTPAKARPPAWKGRYTVQGGDSLGALAHDYGTTLTALAAANNLDPAKPLLIGTVLNVPVQQTATSAWSGSYVVEPGDSLSGIALRYGVSLDALAAANHLDPSAVLTLGVRLAVPSKAAASDLARLDESDPYAAGAIGYDTSYPGCAGIPPADDAFTLVGLNAGRPFTSNPCFAQEWAATTGPRSVYINTAYSPTLMRHLTPDCAAAGAGQPFAAAAQRAYAVGCSEADAALAQLGVAAPLTIWLDVEPANTWSAQPALNDATISGILEQLLAHDPHTLVGIYSKAVFWVKITGDWHAPGVPEWIATGAAGASTCGGAFAGGPVWLSQQANGLLDFDTAC